MGHLLAGNQGIKDFAQRIPNEYEISIIRLPELKVATRRRLVLSRQLVLLFLDVYRRKNNKNITKTKLPVTLTTHNLFHDCHTYSLGSIVPNHAGRTYLHCAQMSHIGASVFDIFFSL